MVLYINRRFTCLLKTRLVSSRTHSLNDFCTACDYSAIGILTYILTLS